MRNIVLNIIAVLLLLVIAVGIFTMPRFNYDEMHRQQASLDQRLHFVESNLIRAANEASGSAAPLRDLIENLSHDYSIATEQIAQHQVTIEKILSILDNLQTGNSLSPNKENQAQKHEFKSTYLEPIELSKELRSTADNYSPRKLSQADFNEFVSTMIDSKLVPYSNFSEIPPDKQVSLQIAYRRYKNVLALVAQQEQVILSELKDMADESNDFVDIPNSAADPNEYLKVFQDRKIGITASEPLDPLGVRRVYHFPYEANPIFIELDKSRDNARYHLIRDVADSFTDRG